MKNLQKLGIALNKAEQKSISGGKKLCIVRRFNAPSCCTHHGRACATADCALGMLPLC